jgi:hypothetical protein
MELYLHSPSTSSWRDAIRVLSLYVPNSLFLSGLKTYFVWLSHLSRVLHLSFTAWNINECTMLHRLNSTNGLLTAEGH